MNNPNIVSITCHDLGRHLGCYEVSTIRTPNLDKMAAEGVRFSSSFCTSPGCSPSRASLYTGRYPHNNGVMGLTHAYFAWDLYPEERHLVQYLNDSGYKSKLVGLQHETRHPEKLGFTDGIGNGGQPCEQTAKDAIIWLEANQNVDSPLYLQMGFFEPHRKFDFGGAKPDDSNGVYVPPFLIDDAGAQAEFAEYQGAIHKVDAAIGQVLDWLATSKLNDNTIIIFTTDHGMPFPRAKCTLYDPGIEVAHLVKWHGKPWSDGRIISKMVSNIDQVPTLLELIGAPIPENIQGQSYLPLLENRPYQKRDAIFAEKTYHGRCDPMRCIRTKNHKVIVNFTAAPAFEDSSQTYHSKTITRVPEDPAHAYHEPVELYDLINDPYEQCNLANEPVHKEIKQNLLNRLYSWMQETKDPLLKEIPLPPMHHLAMDALTT
jgi:N-sulfoglucosamine sulfohydrolase